MTICNSFEVFFIVSFVPWRTSVQKEEQQKRTLDKYNKKKKTSSNIAKITISFDIYFVYVPI